MTHAVEHPSNAAKLAGTLDAGSSVAKPGTQSDSNPVEGAPSITSASSAAKPSTSQLDPSALASESMTLTLPDVLSRLRGESLQADAQQLLQDIPVLQEWQRVRNPSHKVRDDMLKLGKV